MKGTSLSIFMLFSSILFAQVNVTPIGQLTYSSELNDIWGYVDNNGIEYALVGTQNETSVVSLADPSNPQELFSIPGAFSVWRDLKTYGNYAYVITDQGADGLLVIDLSTLPSTTPSYTFFLPSLNVLGSNGILEKGHNLYIDENGIMYLSGSNLGNGQVLLFDLNTTNGLPSYLGAAGLDYSHDAYARGDTLWSSDINDGYFSVWDVSNKANPTLLAQQNTPRNFSHNAWISDDGNTLFTTDERNDAFIGSYDVSDLSDIKEIDRWRPIDTEGTGVIPHNVHVLNDYVVISHYTDGLKVLDANRPDNMIEVASFDTYPFTGGYASPAAGFNGAWGAYPFLPSGNVLVTDINTGLHILDVQYQRACYLEGLITSVSGATLQGVQVEISGLNESGLSSILGEYKTGTVQAGTYVVTYSKVGYLPETRTVTLVNGQVTQQDVQMTQDVPFVINIKVVDQATNLPITNAKVRVNDLGQSYNGSTNSNGEVTTSPLFSANFEITAGKWGHLSNQTIQMISSLTSGNQIVIALEKGYQDEFLFDFGWTAVTSATSGEWEITEPTGLFSNQGDLITPNVDISGDIGTTCYVTGANDNSPGDNDVDNGTTILTSPVFDLTDYQGPRISFYYWFRNLGGSAPLDDKISVTLDNGITSVLLSEYDVEGIGWNGPEEFIVSDFIAPTANMTISFQAEDLTAQHISEAAIDWFRVFEDPLLTINTVSTLSAKIYPNPAADQITISLTSEPKQNTTYEIIGVLGDVLQAGILTQKSSMIELSQSIPSGSYFVRIKENNSIASTVKLIRL